MEFDTWHLWVLAAIVFFILEIFIPSFLMASIGIGCVFAFLGAFLNAPVALQIILFIIGTLLGVIGVKPLMTKYAYQKKAINTNAGGLVGKLGKVLEEIDEKSHSGCVAIDGDQWKSVAISGQIIPVGEKVRVVAIDSIVLTVEPLENNHPQKDPETIIPEKKESERLTLKVGSKTFFLGLDEIAFLYSANKITYVVTGEGKQYVHDLSLENLNKLLSPEMFFRANRQFIVTRNVVAGIRPENNGKIRVSLNVHNGFPDSLIISRLKAATFREWLKTG
ncbi:MAG: NfeD family protein [Draconibacterium sp.]